MGISGVVLRQYVPDFQYQIVHNRGTIQVTTKQISNEVSSTTINLWVITIIFMAFILAPFAQADPPNKGTNHATVQQCQTAYQTASSHCIQTANTVGAVGGAAVTSIGAKSQEETNINQGATGLQQSAQIGQAGNETTAVACEEARAHCASVCGKAMNTHQAKAKANTVDAARHNQHAQRSKGIMAKCNANLGAVSASSWGTAATLGVAAVGAGAVIMATKSGGGGGGGAVSGGQTPGGAGGGEIIGIGVGIDAKQFWDDNNCEAVVNGTAQASEEITEKCKDIAGQLGQGELVLGNCADEIQHSAPSCYDALNDYCVGITPSVRMIDKHCASFCEKVDHADACVEAQVGVAVPAVPVHCGHPTMVGKQQCHQTMVDYCGKHGTAGTGCATFCRANTGVCAN